MAIDKAKLLAFVNKKLVTSETSVDEELRMVIRDLEVLHVLTGKDTSQNLTNASWYLNYPSDCLPTEQAIISVVLFNGSGDAIKLRPLSGGWQDYLWHMNGARASLRSVPSHYTTYEQKIHLLAPPGGNYTSEIYYYRRHATSLATIEFGDEWERAIFFGVTAELAASYGREKYVALWGGRYESEKAKCALAIPRVTSVVE